MCGAVTTPQGLVIPRFPWLARQIPGFLLGFYQVYYQVFLPGLLPGFFPGSKSQVLLVFNDHQCISLGFWGPRLPEIPGFLSGLQPPEKTWVFTRFITWFYQVFTRFFPRFVLVPQHMYFTTFLNWTNRWLLDEQIIPLLNICILQVFWPATNLGK